MGMSILAAEMSTNAVGVESIEIAQIAPIALHVATAENVARVGTAM